MMALTLRAALGSEVGRPYMTTALAKGLDFPRARRPSSDSAQRMARSGRGSPFSSRDKSPLNRESATAWVGEPS